MSKRIENILNSSIPKLLKVKDDLMFRYGSDYAIDNELDKEIDEVCQKLKNSSMRDLHKVKQKINDQLISIMREQLESQQSGQTNPDLPEQQELNELEQRIISKTIEIKQQYQKQFTHPIERNIIRSGLFTATSPNEETLQRIRTKDGIIEQVRNGGFRRLYYRNENGNLLTGYDSKIFIGLMKLWEIKGKNKIIEFEFKDLIKVLETDPNGGEYVTIGKSLDNLARTSIIMEEYLDPKSGKKTSTRIHNPITDAHIIHQNGEARAKIKLNDYIHDSLVAGNYVLINMSLFNDLATPTSKQLYLYIVNELPENQRIIDIDQLINHIGIHASTRFKAVKMLKEAFTELKDFDVLRQWKSEKEGRTEKFITFSPSDWLMKQPIPLFSQQTELSFLDH